MKAILLIWDHTLQSSVLEHYWEHRLWIFLKCLFLYLFSAFFFPGKDLKWMVVVGGRLLHLIKFLKGKKPWQSFDTRPRPGELWSVRMNIYYYINYLVFKTSFLLMLTIIYNKVKILIGFPYSRLSKSLMKSKLFVKKCGAFGIIKSSRIFKQVNRRCAYLFEGYLPSWFILCLSSPQDQGLAQQWSFKMK